jgi:hypothetical protein
MERCKRSCAGEGERSAHLPRGTDQDLVDVDVPWLGDRVDDAGSDVVSLQHVADLLPRPLDCLLDGGILVVPLQLRLCSCARPSERGFEQRAQLTPVERLRRIRYGGMSKGL